MHTVGECAGAFKRTLTVLREMCAADGPVTWIRGKKRRRFQHLQEARITFVSQFVHGIQPNTTHACCWWKPQPERLCDSSEYALVVPVQFLETHDSVVCPLRVHLVCRYQALQGVAKFSQKITVEELGTSKSSARSCNLRR